MLINRRSVLKGIGALGLGAPLLASGVNALGDRPVAANSNPNAVPDEPAFFALLDLTRSDLADVKKAADQQDWTAAKHAWALHLANRHSPNWLWSHRDKAAIIDVENKQFGGLSRYISAANTVIARDFKFQGLEKHLQKDPQWNQGPNEWTHVLSRFGYWGDEGRAYWATGDAKYASDFVYLLQNWIADNPVPPDANESWSTVASTWRTLEAGIRTNSSWFDAMQFFMDAPEFDDEAKYQMTRSLVEHAHYLQQWEYAYRSGNWQIVECSGLASVGIMLPEFKQSADWRGTGFNYLVQHMQKDVEPDGMHWEMTPEYMIWVMQLYANTAHLAQSNSYAVPGLLDRHEKMYDALMRLCQPERIYPPLGDCIGPLGSTKIAPVMAEGALLYKRADMRYLGTDTPQENWIWQFGLPSLANYAKLSKTVPSFMTTYLPNSQYIAMRTGWQASDRYLLFDCAPYHGGHNHRDSMQVIVYADGRNLIIDPGQTVYDQPLSQTMRTGIEHSILTIDSKEQPPLNATLLSFHTDSHADFSSGSLAENDVVHQRSVLFVKPDYWVVVDHVQGSGTHEIDRLFHLPLGPQAAVDRQSVRTAFPEGTNVQILPMDDPEVQTHIEIRAVPIPGAHIPEIIQAQSAALTATCALPATFCTILTPFKPSEKLPTVTRLASENPQIVRLRIVGANGQTDEIAIAAQTEANLSAADQQASGIALLVRRDPNAESTTVIKQELQKI